LGITQGETVLEEGKRKERRNISSPATQALPLLKKASPASHNPFPILQITKHSRQTLLRNAFLILSLG
jgi:hypothetical protein